MPPSIEKKNLLDRFTADEDHVMAARKPGLIRLSEEGGSAAIPEYSKFSQRSRTGHIGGHHVKVLSSVSLFDVIPSPRFFLYLFGTDIQVLFRRHNMKIVF